MRGCEFLDSDWHVIHHEGRQWKDDGIYIGKHVWIGCHAKILKGVTIGNNSVIGAGSVVTRYLSCGDANQRETRPES